MHQKSLAESLHYEHHLLAGRVLRAWLPMMGIGSETSSHGVYCKYIKCHARWMYT